MPHPYPTDDPVDELWLVRHGETEWSRTGHSSSTGSSVGYGCGMGPI